jgi:hypothetical protein
VLLHYPSVGEAACKVLNGEFIGRGMRKMMASKDVHAPVTLAEAKQGLVGLYFFLFNVCQHLSQKP